MEEFPDINGLTTEQVETLWGWSSSAFARTGESQTLPLLNLSKRLTPGKGLQVLQSLRMPSMSRTIPRTTAGAPGGQLQDLKDLLGLGSLRSLSSLSRERGPR